MSDYPDRHDFADGKYTVINDRGKLTALRYGEPWRDITGDNLIYWMLVEVAALKQQLAEQPADTEDNRVNAARYKKLRRWMSSNVQEGWTEVEHLGGIASWQGWNDMDQYLDTLPECEHGLCTGCKSNDSTEGPQLEVVDMTEENPHAG
jgi:hypothetical protein